MRGVRKETAPAVRPHPEAWTTGGNPDGQGKDTAGSSVERGKADGSPREPRSLPQRADGRGGAPAPRRPDTPPPSRARTGLDGDLGLVFSMVGMLSTKGIFSRNSYLW